MESKQPKFKKGDYVMLSYEAKNGENHVAIGEVDKYDDLKRTLRKIQYNLLGSLAFKYYTGLITL